jgi:hypothetical protein
VIFDGEHAGMNGMLFYNYHSKLMQSHITTILQFTYVHVGSKINVCTGIREFSYYSPNSCHHSKLRHVSQVLGSDILSHGTLCGLSKICELNDRLLSPCISFNGRP